MSICPICRKPVDPRLTRCPWDGTPLGTIVIDPLLGTYLGGRYLLRKCIGERELFRLYTAEERGTSRPVLATVRTTSTGANDKALRRFLTLAETAKSLNHPSCTAIRDYGRMPDGRAFIIEEGEVWHQLSQELVLKGRLPVSRAVELAIQLMEGLDHLHGKGIYHTGVSTSSLRLIFDDRGALKLQIPTSEVVARVFEGEDWACAPGENGAGLAADLDAAARVLSDMLTGTVEQEKTHIAELSSAALQLDEEVTATLRTIVERGLGRAGQPFGSAWEMRRDLEALTGRSRFGRYNLLHRIAVGGMGEIYLARAEGIEGIDINRLCVIKTIRTSLVQSGEFVERFLAEARVLASLTHGNIVPVYDVGKVGSVFYIAMEHVAGKDLRKILSRASKEHKRMSVPLALFIAKELANGLAYAHRAKVQGIGGLVHRDVSPHNTLVSYEGEVKLIDFGLAKGSRELQDAPDGVVMGKVCYLSPEQARAEPLDQRTDVYSAGLVLFELLTGDPFFNQPTMDEVLKHVAHPVAQPPSSRASGIPPEVDRICMRAMAPDREGRYRSAGALRDDLTAELARLAPRTNPEEVGAFVRALFGTERKDEETLFSDLSLTIPPLGGPLAASGSGDTDPVPPSQEGSGGEAMSLLGRTPKPIYLASTMMPLATGQVMLGPAVSLLSPAAAGSAPAVSPAGAPVGSAAAVHSNGLDSTSPASVATGYGQGFPTGPEQAIAGRHPAAGIYPPSYTTAQLPVPPAYQPAINTAQVPRAEPSSRWRSSILILLLVVAVGGAGLALGLWVNQRRVDRSREVERALLNRLSEWGSARTSQSEVRIAADAAAPEKTSSTLPSKPRRSRPSRKPVALDGKPCYVTFRGGEGYQVVLDGNAVGMLPLSQPLPLGAGRHAIEVTSGKLVPLRKSVVCSGNEDFVVTVTRPQ